MRKYRRVCRSRPVTIAAISICAIACSAQYRIFPGKADSDLCNPISPARICLGAIGESHCYAPPNEKYGPSDKYLYIFGLDPKAKAVGRFNGQELTLFTAMFSDCGSGTLTDFSLLTTRDGEFIDLLPQVRLTNQSEYKLWSLPQVSSLPVFATADFIWDFDAMQKSNYNEETHFAAHRYRIEAFVFDAKSGHYLEEVRYDTAKKYPGLDQVDRIEVLNDEKPAIVVKLKQSLSH